MERFNLSLVSDPPLEETDILSLLTIGQIGKQLKALREELELAKLLISDREGSGCL